MQEKPAFLVLCAIWNHQQHWTENLIQLFLDQDYEGNSFLVLIDDRPVKTDFTLISETSNGYGKGVGTLHMPERAACLPCKYDFGIESSIGYDYVCVWDDDDIYLPHCLSDHAEVLATHQFSYPTHVFSSYGGTFNTEQSAGRFWTSTAYRAEALKGIGGYGDSKNMAYDQGFIDRMKRTHGEPGSPKRPGFVYNWDITQDNHTSANSGAGESGWYDNTPPTTPVGALEPKYNAITRELLTLAARELS